MNKLGKVFLIGAGPGDPELLTLKAVRMLAAADVVVFDRLVAPDILAMAPPAARRIDVGKASGRHMLPQPQINALLVQLAGQGLTVARLKGGDPFIFGRGSEEALELVAAGVPFEVAPGITAAQGCAASAGVPLTHRGLASGVRYVTGHRREDGPLDLDWAGLADPDTTLVVYMGGANIALIAERLMAHGLPADTPALAVSAGTTARERRRLTRLADLGACGTDWRAEAPALFLIGRVAGLYAAAPRATVAALAAGAVDA